MNKENDKLNKFKAEAKLKSNKSDLFNSYLKKTNNIDDKIALIKFKYKMLISLWNYDLIKELFSSIDIYLC